MSAQPVSWMRVDSCNSISVNPSVKINNGDVFTEVNCDQPITYTNGIFSSPKNSIVRMSSSGDYKMSAGHFQILENFTADNAGNIYVIGRDSLIDNTYFSCCKYNSVGNLLWHFPIGTNYGVHISQTLLVPDGFVFGGDWTNYAGPWAGSFNLFLAKTDFNGNLKFLYKYDNHNSGSIGKILFNNNNILVSGSYSDPMTIKDSTTSITLNGFSNYFAKFTLNGTLITAKDISPSVVNGSMVADNSGNIYFGSWDTTGLFLYKFNNNGISTGFEHIADAGLFSKIYELKFDPSGNLYFSAIFYDSLVLNNSQTFYSDSYGVCKNVLIRRNISGIYDWFLYPECFQCGYGFDFFDECDLSVNIFYRDSIKIYGNNYYAQRGNILSRINCNVGTCIPDTTRTNVLCNGQFTGTAIAIPNGGQPPYTYLWAPGGQTTATITGIGAGTYTYTITDSGSNTTSAVVAITQPTPLLLSETHTNVLCNGQYTGEVTLIAIGGKPSYTYSGATSGLCASTYTYTVTDANGCIATTTATITQAIEIIVSATAENTSTFTNSTTNSLTGTPAGGIFSGAGVSGTNFNPSVAGIGTWPVTYTYTDENGCTATATINITVDMSTGIAMNGAEGAALEIYPNPSSGIFILNLKNKKAETKICVYDALGKCVFDKVSKNDKEKIDLSAQPKGIYTLEIESDGKSAMKKIVLQ